MEIALVDDITFTNRSWHLFTRRWRRREQNWNRVSQRYHFPKSIMTFIFSGLLTRRRRRRERNRNRTTQEKGQVAGHDCRTRRNLPRVLGEMQRGLLFHLFFPLMKRGLFHLFYFDAKRFFVLPFLLRCKEVCCFTFFYFDGKRFVVSLFWLWKRGFTFLTLIQMEFSERDAMECYATHSQLWRERRNL